MVEDHDSPPHDEFLFLQIVSMFQMAAMQQLGKIMNPVTSKIEKDLNQAKFSIDTIEVLKQKTRGNLTKTEDEFLNKVLFELQMNYVEELETSKGRGEDTDDSESSNEAGDDGGSSDEAGDDGGSSDEAGDDGGGEESPPEVKKD